MGRGIVVEEVGLVHGGAVDPMSSALFLQDFCKEEEAGELVEAGELIVEFDGLLPLEDLVRVIVALVVQSHIILIGLIQPLYIEVYPFLPNILRFTIKIFY